jgi:nuclear pore complex protein Nup205
VLRVIVSAVFSRGLHNEQMKEQTRVFLTENRPSMVGIFKRFAKIGGDIGAGHHETLRDLAKAYTALVAATDFLEVSRGTPGPARRLRTDWIQFEDSEVTQFSRPGLFS